MAIVVIPPDVLRIYLRVGRDSFVLARQGEYLPAFCASIMHNCMHRYMSIVLNFPSSVAESRSRYLLSVYGV